MTEEVHENTDEVVEQVIEPTEQSAADAAADFESGFQAVMTGEEPAHREPDRDPGEHAAVDLEKVEKAQEVINSLSREEIEALINGRAESIESRVFGKIGEFNRTLQQLQQSQPGQTKLEAEKLKRLREIDPEFADAIAADLSEALVVGSSQPAIDENAVRNFVGSAMNSLAQEYEAKLLTVAHPDWKEVATSDEFQAWLGKKPAEEQQSFNSTWDSTYLARVFNEYKRGLASDEQKTTEKSNRSRLQRSAMPSKNAAPAPAGASASEEDAFLAGFNAVRGSG